MEPLVSIAIPTFNRPKYLDRALSQLRAQTYSRLEVIVSDNASTDPEVGAVMRKHCDQDLRIKYIRQLENIGPYRNYIAALDNTTGDFVMWASDDDQWSPDYVAELYACLQKHPAAGLAFCGMEIVNLDDKVIGRLDGFSRFTSTGDRYADARRFLAEDEIGGKSNPIYGLYRRAVIINAVDRLWRGRNDLDALWSADVVFVFAVMMKYGLVCLDKVMFRKEKRTRRASWVSYRPRWYSRGAHLKDYAPYTAALRDAVDDPALKDLVVKVMRRRYWKEVLIGKPLRPFMKLVERAGRLSWQKPAA